MVLGRGKAGGALESQRMPHLEKTLVVTRDQWPI
jgi:hypothetical protein